MSQRVIFDIRNLDTYRPENKAQRIFEPICEKQTKIRDIEKVADKLNRTRTIESYYSVQEISKMLRISTRWLYDSMNTGKLKYYQLGAKARKLKISDVTALIESQSRK